MREGVLAQGTLCIHIISKLAKWGLVSFTAVIHFWEILCDIKFQREEDITRLLLGKAVCAAHERYVHAVLYGQQNL